MKTYECSSIVFPQLKGLILIGDLGASGVPVTLRLGILEIVMIGDKLPKVIG